MIPAFFLKACEAVMSDPFDAMVDDVFAEEGFGFDASYTPPGGGDAQGIRVLRQQEGNGLIPSLGTMGAAGAARIFEVRRSEVTPQKGGTITLGTEDFTIADILPADADERLIRLGVNKRPA